MNTPLDLLKAIGMVILSLGLIFFSAWGFFTLYNAEPTDCTCRFQRHRVHFGDQYTKVNRKCWHNSNGHVVVGDTVYLDVKWFTNECE